MRPFCPSIAAFGFAWLAAILPAQEPQTPESSGAVIRSNVREVVLDVVARRKNLSLATKLKASDFTITEDGVPQTIRSFRSIGGREARVIAPPPKPNSGSLQPRCCCGFAIRCWRPSALRYSSRAPSLAGL
jgi:hypothetical protein